MFALALVLSLIAVDPSTTLKPTPVKQQVAEQSVAEAPLSNVSVTLDCAALANGRVGDCAVVEETRPGLGFGEAAVALMNGAPIDPTLRRGQSSPVRFQHTIRFTP